MYHKQRPCLVACTATTVTKHPRHVHQLISTVPVVSRLIPIAKGSADLQVTSLDSAGTVLRQACPITWSPSHLSNPGMLLSTYAVTLEDIIIRGLFVCILATYIPILLPMFFYKIYPSVSPCPFYTQDNFSSALNIILPCHLPCPVDLLLHLTTVLLFLRELCAALLIQFCNSLEYYFLYSWWSSSVNSSCSWPSL
eukprot:GHVQ01022835.1.p1 GENE.GHVQ01022835.1~~GHVQ01022835.1.p1  ORF type:complete len:196 (-),score=10.54 GHVQ01022835.1:248-835(-)